MTDQSEHSPSQGAAGAPAGRPERDARVLEPRRPRKRTREEAIRVAGEILAAALRDLAEQRRAEMREDT